MAGEGLGHVLKAGCDGVRICRACASAASMRARRRWRVLVVQPIGTLAEPERALGAEAEAGLDGQRDASGQRQIGVVGPPAPEVTCRRSAVRRRGQPSFGQQVGVIGDQAGARGAADAGLAAGAVQRDALDLAMAKRRRHQRMAAFVDGDALRHRGSSSSARKPRADPRP